MHNKQNYLDQPWKIAKVALVFVSAFATFASARHLKAKKDEEAKTEMQRDLAPAYRELGGWRPSGYHETCGCIADYTKELTAFQFEVIAGLSPLLFTDADYAYDGASGLAGDDIIGAINMVAMEASNELIAEYMCGCENYDVVSRPFGRKLQSSPPPGQCSETNSTNILALGNGDDGEAIGYNPTDGLMYHSSGIRDGQEFFESIDLASLTVGPNLAPDNTYPGGMEEWTGMVYYPPIDAFIAMDRDEKIVQITTTGTFSHLSTLSRSNGYIRGFAVVGTSFYGVDPGSSDLVQFNPFDGSVVATVPVTIDGVQVSAGSTGLTTHPLTGDVYIIYKCGSNTRCLGTIDVITGAGTAVGNGDTGMKFSGISFDNAGNLYAISGDGASPSSTLFRFECSSTVGTFPAALAFSYQECCCNAEIVKDVYKNQMQTIAEMPSGYWLSGASAARDVWISALKNADASVLDTLTTYTPFP